MKTEVLCPTCGVLVGWDYPDYFSYSEGWGEPGYFEPIEDGVENIRDESGMVYCSQTCLEEKK